MIKGIKYFLIIFLLVVSMCTKENNTLKNIIEIEYKDVSEYYNLKFESIKNINLEFNEKDPLRAITRIDFDSKNNIYICDYMSSNVKVYEKNGKLLRTIGRAGRGPNEYIGLKSIFVDKNNNDDIYISDVSINRITCLDKKGNYIYDFPIDSKYYYSGVGMFKKENKFYIPAKDAHSNFFKDVTRTYVIAELDMKGKIIKTMGKIDEIYNEYNLTNMLRTNFENKIINNNIYYTLLAYYKVYYINLNNGNVYKFGIKGKNFHKLIKNPYTEPGVSLKKSLNYRGKLTHMTKPFLMNNNILLVEYYNNNKMKDRSGKNLYDNGKENLFDGYIQVYDLKNKLYLGEIYIGQKKIICMDNNDYLYAIKDHGSNELIKYNLKIIKKGNNDEK